MILNVNSLSARLNWDLITVGYKLSTQKLNFVSNAGFTLDISCPEIRVTALFNGAGVTHTWVVNILDGLTASGESAIMKIPYNGAFQVTHLVIYPNGIQETETKTILIDCVTYSECMYECTNQKNNLITNPNLLLVNPLPPGQNMWESFYSNLVPGWSSSRYTPHHVDIIKFTKNGQVEWVCNPGTTFNCLSSLLFDWSEGIYANVNFVKDDELTYCISLESNQLSCGSGVGELQLRACNGLESNNLAPFSNGLDPDFEVIYNGPSNGGNPNLSYKPSKNFTQFEIIHHNGLTSIVSINDVNVSCITTALKQINITQLTDCLYRFNPEGTKQFCNYEWKVNNIVVGTAEILEYKFPLSGDYNINLKVIDCNGCCAEKCIDVNVVIPPLIGSIVSNVICNNNVNSQYNNEVNFSSTSIGTGLSYLWSFGDGSTSTLTNPVHNYATSGTYTVSVTVTDLCDQMITDTKVIAVLCNEIGEVSCGKNTYRDIYVVDGTVSPVSFDLYRQQNSIPSFPFIFTLQIINQKFLVRGVLEVDDNFEFIGCEFLFDAGAELRLKGSNKSKLVSFVSSTLRACSGIQWKGVYSEVGDHRFYQSTIEDAEFGIKVNNNGYVQVNQTKFYNNVIGMYFTKNASHIIANSVFEGTKPNLLANHSAQTFIKTKPFSGLYFNNVAQGSVGGGINSENVFKYLTNGIIAANTNLVVNKAKFSHIGYGVLTYLNQPYYANSNAIFISGGNNVSISESVFNGISSIPGSYTTNAIYIKSIQPMNINITKNNIYSYAAGINLNALNNSIININKCSNDFFVNGQISCGLSIVNSEPLNNVQVNIENNDFNLSNITRSNTAVSFIGTLDNSVYKFLNNKVNVYDVINNPTSGVFSVLTVDNLEFANNVFKSYTHDFSNLVRINNSKNLRFNDNYLYNLASNTFIENAVSLRNLSKPIIRCNLVSKTKNGFYFDRVGSNSGVTFATNHMEQSIIGLKVDQNITPQNNQGNIWSGDNTRALLQAGGDPYFSTFLVNPNQPSPIAIVGGKFRPDVVTPQNWFDNISNNAPTCFGPSNLPNPQGRSISGNHVEELGIKLADSIYDSNIEKWCYQTRLYEDFLLESDLITENALNANSYNSISSDVIAYYDANNDLARILRLSDSEESSLNSIQNDISLIIDRKNELWNTIQNSTVGADSLVDVAYAFSLELDQLKSLEKALIEQIESRTINELVIFKNQVNSLTVNEDFQNDIKDIITIKADTRIYGYNGAKDIHSTKIKEIANKCYIEYGESVTEAIKLAKVMWGEEISLNYDGCTAQPRAITAKAGTESSIVIQPNPGSSKVSITSDRAVRNIVFSLINGSNNLTIRRDFDIIDVSSLPTGVYVVKLTYHDGSKELSKFIKIN